MDIIILRYIIFDDMKLSKKFCNSLYQYSIKYISIYHFDLCNIDIYLSPFNKIKKYKNYYDNWINKVVYIWF